LEYPMMEPPRRSPQNYEKLPERLQWTVTVQST
jgi:hypothetical protein